MTHKVAFRLGKGYLQDTHSLLLYGMTRQANAADERWSVGLQWAENTWSHWTVNSTVCGLALLYEGAERVMIVVGMDGFTLIADSTGVHEVQMDPSEDGPNDLRNITGVTVIAGEAFAFGMSRMVYRRPRGELAWVRADEGMRLPRGTAQIAGVRSMDGDGLGRLIAVGFYGEIWLSEAGRWHQVDSPTNAKLEAVLWGCGEVFIAGAAGTLLRGSVDALHPVNDPTITDTFWCMEWFDGALYLSTNKGRLYKFKSEQLSLIDQFPQATTGWLHSTKECLLSVGSRDVCLLSNGVWSMLPPPAVDDVPFDWSVD